MRMWRSMSCAFWRPGPRHGAEPREPSYADWRSPRSADGARTMYACAYCPRGTDAGAVAGQSAHRKDALLLLARAPSPARAAKLTRSQVVSALRSARRHHVQAEADALLTVLRAPGLRQTPTLEAAYAAIVVTQVGIITALNEQITQLQEVLAEHFGRHPSADIYLNISASRASGRSWAPAPSPVRRARRQPIRVIRVGGCSPTRSRTPRCWPCASH